MEVWSGENGEKRVWFEEEGKMIWGKWVLNKKHALCSLRDLAAARFVSRRCEILIEFEPEPQSVGAAARHVPRSCDPPRYKNTQRMGSPGRSLGLAGSSLSTKKKLIIFFFFNLTPKHT